MKSGNHLSGLAAHMFRQEESCTKAAKATPTLIDIWWPVLTMDVALLAWRCGVSTYAIVFMQVNCKDVMPP